MPYKCNYVICNGDSSLADKLYIFSQSPSLLEGACHVEIIYFIYLLSDRWKSTRINISLSRPEKIFIKFWPPPKMWFIYAKK